MRTLFKLSILILLAAVLLSACSQKPTPTTTSVPTAEIRGNEAGLRQSCLRIL